MSRSSLPFVLVVGALLAFSRPARAGTYLDTCALLLDGARRGAEWVQRHAGDADLARTAHEIADARVRAARRMSVPREVEKAHPHMLLALEQTERALAAAVEGDFAKFGRHLAQAREQERTFRSVLAQGKLALPDLDGKK